MNWIRLKSPPIASASVLIAIVLASPGTPSTSRCPRASSATTIRSSRWSCPTMTFLTSYRSRSIGGRRCASRLVLSRGVSSCGGSVRGQAGGAAGDVDGHGQADADEHVLLGRVDERGHDADDGAARVEQRAAGVAGVDRGVHLDEALITWPVSLRRNERSRPDTTPALIEPVRPNGLPTM